MKPLRTRVAHAGWADHRLRHRWLFGEVLGRVNLTRLTVLALTGRELDGDAAAMVDDLAVVTSVAEPRIWPLKVARLVASYGGTMAGFAAGCLWADQARVGFWTSGRAAASLVALAEALGDGAGDPDRVAAEVRRRLTRGEVIVGFGVPFRDEDERVVALRRQVQARGRDAGRYWTLLEHLAAAMRAERGVGVNIGLGLGAVLLDLDFEPEAISVLAVGLGHHTFLANAHEGAVQGAPALRHLPEEAVAYVGADPRPSPRAAARDGVDGDGVSP